MVISVYVNLLESTSSQKSDENRTILNLTNKGALIDIAHTWYWDMMHFKTLN